MEALWISLGVVAFAVAVTIMSNRRRRAAAEAAAVMHELRETALTEHASELGITPEPGKPWGFVMETGYPEAVVSLVVFADGSTSLYFSKGGGFLGGGENPNVNQAARALVAKAATETHYFKPAIDHTLPSEGMTRFYLRTDAGLLTAEAPENELGENRHPLSALFHTAHEVLTQIRLISEERRRPGG